MDFIDPDAELVESSFSWDQEFQKHIIALLLTDRSFLLQSIDLIKPNYFTNKVHQYACDFLFNFFKKYRTVPSRMVLNQEIADKFHDDKARLYYLGELNSIFDYFEPSVENREYLSDKIAFFAKIQAIRAAFNKSLKLMDKDPESDDTWSNIYDLLREAMNTDKNFDIGLEYFKNIQDRYERMTQEEEEREKFVTGCPTIDENIKGGGYGRGEMVSVVGGSGVGKSVLLTCLAASNILRGKRGLYLSLELNQDRVAERFDSILSGLPISYLYDVKDQVFNKLNYIVDSCEDKNMLVVKYFPSASANVDTIRAYLYQLKFYGFTPDFIIVDYVGEMKDHPGLPTHESRERMVKELRGLAGEENVFMATAMQPNRGSKEAQKTGRIEEEHLADSFGQIRPLDGCFSLNQNESEKAVGIGRIYVIKQRFGKSRYQIYVKFDPETLKIYEISHEVYKDLMTRKKAAISESVESDLANSICKPMDADNEATRAANLAKQYTPSDALKEGENGND